MDWAGHTKLAVLQKVDEHQQPAGTPVPASLDAGFRALGFVGAGVLGPLAGSSLVAVVGGLGPGLGSFAACASAVTFSADLPPAQPAVREPRRCVCVRGGPRM